MRVVFAVLSWAFLASGFQQAARPISRVVLSSTASPDNGIADRRIPTKVSKAGTNYLQRIVLSSLLSSSLLILSTSGTSNKISYTRNRYERREQEVVRLLQSRAETAPVAATSPVKSTPKAFIPKKATFTDEVTEVSDQDKRIGFLIGASPFALIAAAIAAKVNQLFSKLRSLEKIKKRI